MYVHTNTVECCNKVFCSDSFSYHTYKVIDLLTHQKQKSNFILTDAVKLKMINQVQDRMIFDDFSVNFEPIS